MSSTNLATETFVCVTDHSSIECRIGKKLTALLRHDSPLKKHMYSNGAVELRHVLDICNPDVHPYDKFNILEDFLQLLSKETTNRDILLKFH